jgi:hypothetical protein
VTVGLLSPANTSWQADGTSRLISVQDDTILLGDCENDGAFPLVYEASICDGAMEAKCYEKGAPKTEFTRAINNHVNKMRFITIMVVTDANEMKISKTVNKARKGPNVVKITGNATAANPVATELTWTAIRTAHAESPGDTVVQIMLDSIYFGRYELMGDVYHSTNKF